MIMAGELLPLARRREHRREVSRRLAIPRLRGWARAVERIRRAQASRPRALRDHAGNFYHLDFGQSFFHATLSVTATT